MSRYGNSTAVKSVYTDVSLTASQTGNLTTLQITGKAEDMDANGADTFSAALTTGSVVAPADTSTASADDWAASNANVVGVFMTPSFSLTGTITLTNLSGTTGSLMGGKLDFKGDIATTGTGGFTFLSGELMADVANADSKYGTLTFTGTAKKAAGDSGLALTLSVSRDDTTGTNAKNVSASFTIAGVNTIWLTNTTIANGSKDYMIDTSSGLTVDGSGNVMDGDTLVAVVHGSRVYYEDGSYESVL